jgi:hypothetical protein
MALVFAKWRKIQNIDVISSFGLYLAVIAQVVHTRRNAGVPLPVRT